VAGRAGFTFTLKAHQSFTHQSDDGTPPELVPLCRAIDPIAEAGKLGAVLLQFPWSFRFEDESRRHLEARANELRRYPLAVEVRHGSWESPEADAYLAGLGVTVCGIDQPVMGDSLRPYHFHTGPAGAYFRLHGRNYKNWFAENAGRDARYDYLYPPEELSPWAAVIRKAAAEATTSDAGASPAEIAAPTMIAPIPNSTPSRRWTRSRKTSARPIISTPEGAMMPGATGTRHGPLGTHTVPAWPINQFAAGMVRQNNTRKI
jgi:hypothetical protein